MLSFKQELRRQLAADETEKVIQQLLEHTQAIGEVQLHNEMVLHSGKYTQYKKDQRIGTENYTDLIRTKIKINQSLLDVIDNLQVEGQAVYREPGRLRGITEKSLKNHILWMLLGEKLLAIGFVFTLWESGAFTVDQFTSIIAILVPLFAAYFTLLLKDAANNRHAEVALDQRLLVKRSYQWMTYFLLLLYFFLIIMIVSLRGSGVLPHFSDMAMLLAIVESGLGYYIGTVVLALFKKGID